MGPRADNRTGTAAAARHRILDMTPPQQSAVVVVAHYRAKPGAGDEVAAVLATYSPLVRREPGCLCFAPHRSRDDPHAFVLCEKYRCLADLEATRSRTSP
jgi:quinol monooxygenase YgiN